MTDQPKNRDERRSRNGRWHAQLPWRAEWHEIAERQNAAGLRRLETRRGPVRHPCTGCGRRRLIRSFLQNEEGGFRIDACATCRGEPEPSRPKQPPAKLPAPSNEQHYSDDVLLQFIRYDSLRDPRLDRARRLREDLGWIPRRLLLQADAILFQREANGRVPVGTADKIRIERARQARAAGDA